MLKGLIVCYINRNEFDKDQDEEDLLQSNKEINSEFIEKMKEQGYLMLFVTTMNEGSHMEKFDYT
jgi:hypothetical protein